MSASPCRNSALERDLALAHDFAVPAAAAVSFLARAMPNWRRGLILRRQSAAICTTFCSIHPAPPEAAPTVSASPLATSAARVQPPHSTRRWSADSFARMRPTAPARPKCFSLINKSLAERRVEAQYVTLAYAIWKDEDATCRSRTPACRAPFTASKGQIERVEAVGLPLGLFDTVEHEEIAFNAAPGDVFVFFSDGLVDATSPRRCYVWPRSYREDRRANWHLSADDLVKTLFQAVRRSHRRRRTVRRPDRGSAQSERFHQVSRPKMKKSTHPEGRPPAFPYLAESRSKSARSLHCERASSAQAGAKNTARRCTSIPAPPFAIATRLSTAAFARRTAPVCYSVKANSNLSMLRMLGHLGCGLDVVSGGELERVLRRRQTRSRARRLLRRRQDSA